MIYTIRNIDEIPFLEDRTKIGEVMITYKRTLEEIKNYFLYERVNTDEE